MLTPIGGPVNPPLRVLPKRMTQCGNICDVRVVGMNTDLPNMSGLIKTQMNPAFAAIGRLIDTITKRNVDANRGLAGTRVNHIRITVRNRKRTDGGTCQIPIRDAFPVGATIRGFPDASGAGAKVKRHRVRGIAGHRHDSTAPRRADTAPFEPSGY